MEDFELRYAAFRGLNLTFEVREGIIKQSHDYSEKDHPELAEYLLDQRPPLEAQLIDLTDEIAYNTADLDDGYESRLLAYEQIREGVPVFARYSDEVEKLYPDVAEKLKFNETVKRFLNRLVGDLIERPQREFEERRLRRSKMCAIIRNVWPRSALRSKRIASRRRVFSTKISITARALPEKDDAERVVTELFEFWMKDPASLPHNYREKAEEEPLPRIICDYIAGMTDNYIYEQYDKFCGR